MNLFFALTNFQEDPIYRNSSAKDLGIALRMRAAKVPIAVDKFKRSLTIRQAPKAYSN